MLLKVKNNDARNGAFSAWRIVVWLMLLFAGYGCVQYIAHARQLLANMQQNISPEAMSSLRGMLAWDVGYLLGAFAVVVICAGAILRQAWSRPLVQGVAVVLALCWGLLGAISQFSQWRDVSRAVALVASQTPLDAAAQATVAHMRRSYQVAMGMRIVATPVLLWLAWWLGRTPVRAQFLQRAARR